MALLIIYILLALTVSFLCSILEAVLLSITPASIAGAKEKGAKWGERMEGLKSDIDRPLSAILTLNTFAHTMGAAGAGAQYASLFGNVGESIFAGGLTLAILVITEIIPKTLGARFAVPLAAPVSVMLVFLTTTLKPLVWCSKQITKLITPKGGESHTMQREEILAMARMAAESGSLGPRESQFMQNLIQLHGMKVKDIMTPRPVIFALPQSTSLVEFVEKIEGKPFTRIPVYKTNRDEVTGFVIREEALIAHLKDADDTGTLEQVVRPIAVTPEYTPVDVLFQRFISERHQIMLVTDEFGTTIGLVSFEDVIETIFGFEIVDEKDKVADLQTHARTLWHERAKKMGIVLEEEVPKAD
ncbi:CNNM domain-containing protein [Luteolibacter pohnpeiensis]|nr:CNNM domain-containing protein [Luteolibacter pohnpeiensis]